MSEYYQGPNNSAKLKIVTITLSIIAALLVIWRISWRIWKRVIGLSDYLLILGLVRPYQQFLKHWTNNIGFEHVSCWIQP